MGCCNNSMGGSNCLWIILILIIIFGCGYVNGCNGGCNNSCDCGCSGCGC